MNFLVIEDSPAMRRVLCNTLVRMGVENVFEAGDGKEALGIMSQKPIHFILTDWIMPEFDGLQLVQAIRKIEKLKDVPILMVTTKDSKKDVLTAIQAKVDDFVAKPISYELLRNKIISVLDKKGIKHNFLENQQ